MIAFKKFRNKQVKNGKEEKEEPIKDEGIQEDK